MTMNNSFDFGYQFQAINGVSPTLNQINQGMDQLEQNSKEAGNVTQKAFFDMETSARAAEKAMAAFNLMKGMKDDFSDFEAGIAEASTLLKGADVDMKGYTETVLAYSKKYGEMPTQLTKSLYTAMSSGYLTQAEAGKVMEQAMKLSVGGITTAAEAMDGLTTIMHSWGLTTDEVARISDSLFVSMRAGKTTIGELSREIGQVSALADLAHISIEEITAATAALTLGGRNTSESMNGLRAILTEVLRGEKGTMDAAKELGVDFSLTALRSKGLTRFLMDLQEAVMEGGKEEKWAQFFGRVQGLGSAISLTGKQAGKFAEVLKDMEGKAGSTDDAVGKMLETSKYGAKRYEASVMVMRIRIGQALAPLFTIWRKIKLAIVNALTAIAEKAPWLVKLVGIIVLLGAAFVLVVAKIAAAKALFAIFGVFIKAAIASISGALAALAGAFLPIIAAIAAVVAAVIVLKKAYEENWSGFADWVDHATQSVYAFFDAIRQLWTTGEITGPTAEFLMMNKAVWEVTQGVWYLVEAFKFLWIGIKDGFGEVETLFVPFKGVFEVMDRMFRQLGETWRSVTGEMVSDSQEPITIMSAFAALGFLIGTTIRFAFQVIAGALAGIVAVVGAGLGVIYSAFMLVWRVFGGLYRMLSGDFTLGLMEVFTAVFQFFYGIVGIIGNLFDALLYSLVSMFGVTREQYENFFSSLGDAFSTFWDLIVSGFDAAGNGIGIAIDAVGNAFMTVIDAIVLAWDTMCFGLDAAFSWFIDGIRSGLTFVGNAFEAIANFVKSVWDAIFKWFEEKLGWLKDAVSWVTDAASTISGAAGKVMGSIGGGLKRGVGAVGDFLGFGGGGESGTITALISPALAGLLPPGGQEGSATPVSVANAARTPGGEASPSAAQTTAQIAAIASNMSLSLSDAVKIIAQAPPISVKMDGKVVAEIIKDRLKEGEEISLTQVVPTLMTGR